VVPENPKKRDSKYAFAAKGSTASTWVRSSRKRNRIADNGNELVGLLDELVAGWPVPVTEIVLIGHSMGGLVARSAALQAG
jgi:pimeloyl-ACP methyl ester carboxylesterase